MLDIQSQQTFSALSGIKEKETFFKGADHSKDCAVGSIWP